MPQNILDKKEETLFLISGGSKFPGERGNALESLHAYREGKNRGDFSRETLDALENSVPLADYQKLQIDANKHGAANRKLAAELMLYKGVIAFRNYWRL